MAIMVSWNKSLPLRYGSQVRRAVSKELAGEAVPSELWHRDADGKLLKEFPFIQWTDRGIVGLGSQGMQLLASAIPAILEAFGRLGWPPPQVKALPMSVEVGYPRRFTVWNFAPATMNSGNPLHICTLWSRRGELKTAIAERFVQRFFRDMEATCDRVGLEWPGDRVVVGDVAWGGGSLLERDGYHEPIVTVHFTANLKLDGYWSAGRLRHIGLGAIRHGAKDWQDADGSFAQTDGVYRGGLR